MAADVPFEAALQAEGCQSMESVRADWAVEVATASAEAAVDRSADMASVDILAAAEVACDILAMASDRSSSCSRELVVGAGR